MSSYWGLVDAKIRASEKDLPVCTKLHMQLALTLILAQLDQMHFEQNWKKDQNYHSMKAYNQGDHYQQKLKSPFQN